MFTCVANSVRETCIFMILKNFKLEVEKTGICILSIDTENSEINTVNTSVINEFEYVVNKLTNDEDIKGVIINSLKKDFQLYYKNIYLIV